MSQNNSHPPYRNLAATLQAVQPSAAAQARMRLKHITALDANWDVLGSSPPNDKAQKLAFRVLETSYSIGVIEPSLVTASAEGGVGIVYKTPDKYAAIECLNRGSMWLLWFDASGSPQSSKIKANSKAIKEALGRVASIHAAHAHA